MLRKVGFTFAPLGENKRFVLTNVDFEACDVHQFLAQCEAAHEANRSDPDAAATIIDRASQLWGRQRSLAARYPFIAKSDAFDDVERAYRELRGLLVGVGSTHHVTLEKYVSQHVRRCAKVDPRIRGSSQDVILPLDDVYISLELGLDPVASFLQPANMPSESGQLRNEELTTKDFVSQEELSAIDLVQLTRDRRWSVVLGPPGAGKSTLLQWLALCHARALLANQSRVRVSGERLGMTDTLADLGPARLPILVRVADLAEYLSAEDTANGQPRSLFHYLGRQLLLSEPLSGDQDQHAALLHECIRSGTAIVLIDGLDEIEGRDLRSRIRREIESFVADYITDPVSPDMLRAPGDDDGTSWWQTRSSSPAVHGGNQVVITSRVTGYDEYPLDGRYTLAKIRPLTPEMTRRFCQNWCLAVERFRAQSADASAEMSSTDEEIHLRAAKDAGALNHAITSRPSVARIASNPLLLTVLAMLLKGRDQLPTQRVDVYIEAARALVERRPSEWMLEDVIDILGPLALWLHENRPSGVADLTDVRARVATAMEQRLVDSNVAAHAERFIKAAREASGILVEVAPDRFSFVHLTFQEFLAAKEMTRSLAGFRIQVRRRLHVPRWTEVLLLAVASISKDHPSEIEHVLGDLLDAGSPHESWIRRDLLFVASCLAETPRRSPAMLRRVVNDLLEAGVVAEGSDHPQLAERIRSALRDLYAARPMLVQPHLVDALNDVRLSPFATDVCAQLEIVTLDLVDALDLACRSWNRSPRAVTIRARLATHLRKSGLSVRSCHTPIRELLDDACTTAAQKLKHLNKPLWKVLSNLRDRIDPALHEIVKWLLENTDPGTPTIAGTFVDQVLETCQAAEGADFSSLAALAYELDKNRLTGWLHEAVRAESVDLLSAARFLADLPAALPPPQDLDQWYDTLSGRAVTALLRQSASSGARVAFMRLAWSRVNEATDVRSAALSLLHRLAATGTVELTNHALSGLRSLITSADSAERDLGLVLAARADLSADDKPALIRALTDAAADQSDPLRAVAALKVAHQPNTPLTPATYDELSAALHRDNELWRALARNALTVTRPLSLIDKETIERSMFHSSASRECRDWMSYMLHTSFPTRLHTPSAAHVIHGFTELPQTQPFSPSDDAVRDLIGRIPALPVDLADHVMTAVFGPLVNGQRIAADHDHLWSLTSPELPLSVRLAAAKAAGAQAAITGTVESVLEDLDDAPSEVLLPAVRSCAFWLSRSVHNSALIDRLRQLILNLLRTTPTGDVARQAIGAVVTLDAVKGVSSEEILVWALRRSPTVGQAVQAIFSALSGEEVWLVPRTYSNQSLQLNLAVLAARLGDNPRDMRVLLKNGIEVLTDPLASWARKRAALVATEAAASHHHASFLAQARSLNLTDALQECCEDDNSYTVRVTSRLLLGQLTDDPVHAFQLVQECRDFYSLTESMIARLRGLRRPLPVDNRVVKVVLDDNNGTAVWLAAHLLVHRARFATTTESDDTDAVIEALSDRILRQPTIVQALEVKPGQNLRRALHQLLDEVLIASEVPQTAEINIGQLVTEVMLLASHRQSHAPSSGVRHTDSILTLLAARLRRLRDSGDQRIAGPLNVQDADTANWADLGLPDLLPWESRLLTSIQYDLCQMRVGVAIAAIIGKDGSAEFQRFIDHDDEKGALDWLTKRVPSYRAIVRTEVKAVHAETELCAADIIATLRETND